MTEETKTKWEEAKEKLRAKSEEAKKAEQEKYQEEAKARQEERAIVDPVTQTSLTVEQILAAGNMAMGMRGVPTSDIRPPQIILAQKSSDFEQLVDNQGKTVKVGQFFHTGKMEIMDTFDCYFVFAEKGKFINKRKNNEEWDKYTAIGLMKMDLSIFGMIFKSTYLYALSSLFTAVNAQKLPMYAFNCHIEVKKLSGDQGDWYVPVVRVGQVEKDVTVLNELYKTAKRFDGNTSKIQVQDDDEMEAHIMAANPGAVVNDSGVTEKDIPF